MTPPRSLKRKAHRLEYLVSTAPFPDTALVWGAVEATDREGGLAKGVEASFAGNLAEEDFAKAEAAVEACREVEMFAADLAKAVEHRMEAETAQDEHFDASASPPTKD